jgi:hypothetical protein
MNPFKTANYLNMGIVSSYNVSITDKSVCTPFMVSFEMADAVNQYFLEVPRDKRALRIFDWMQSHFVYDKQYLATHGYQGSTEVFANRGGVCGELAYLYVVLARCSGLKSNFVRVTRDCNDKEVLHACAVVKREYPLFVDPAYETFDIHHKEKQILTDKEAMRYFTAPRKRKREIFAEVMKALAR